MNFSFLSFSSIIHCIPLSSTDLSFPSSCLSSYLSVSLSCSIFSLPRSLSLARSLFSPYSPSLASHSYSSFSCFLLLGFSSFLSLVFTLLFLSFILSFSYSFLHPSSFYFPPLLHIFYSFSTFCNHLILLIHILYISYSLSSFFLTFSLSFPFNFAFLVVLFPIPSSWSSTPAIASSYHASFFLSFLSFPIFTILLLFMLSFYISFLLALLIFSSRFSSPFSFFFTDDNSLVLVLNILSFCPIIFPHVQSIWSYYECPILQQFCCLLLAKSMFC